MLEILDGIEKVIVETDEENPTTIAVITGDKIDVADGCRVRMKPVGTKNGKYQCDYCDKKFDTVSEYKTHIKKHFIDFSEKDNIAVITVLRALAEKSDRFREFDIVCGMPVYSFKSLMNAAADRLGKKQEEKRNENS